MKRGAYIYFMTNRYNHVLYVGVTNDIIDAVKESYNGDCGSSPQ